MFRPNWKYLVAVLVVVAVIAMIAPQAQAFHRARGWGWGLDGIDVKARQSGARVLGGALPGHTCRSWVPKSGAEVGGHGQIRLPVRGFRLV